MKMYVLMVAILRFLVAFLLLLGANRICGYPPGVPRAALGAALGGLYGAAYLLPGFHFLGNTLWHCVSLVLICMIAYGWERKALRPTAVFFLLSMALGGVASGHMGLWATVLGAAGLFFLCVIGFRGGTGSGGLVPVELSLDGKQLSILALRDTGNTLTDPITGRPVLVVGAEVASRLTGLTAEQLRRPVESIGLIPGLRLVPYRTIGQTGSMMLAMRLKEVKIGSWKGSGLVAFAPEGLCPEGTYQALTGGTV